MDSLVTFPPSPPIIVAECPKVFDIQCIWGKIFESLENIFVFKYSQIIFHLGFAWNIYGKSVTRTFFGCPYHSIGTKIYLDAALVFIGYIFWCDFVTTYQCTTKPSFGINLFWSSDNSSTFQALTPIIFICNLDEQEKTVAKMESEFTLPYLHCWIIVINKSTSALPFCFVMRHFMKLVTFHQLLNFSRIPIIHLFQLVIIFQRKERIRTNASIRVFVFSNDNLGILIIQNSCLLHVSFQKWQFEIIYMLKTNSSYF